MCLDLPNFQRVMSLFKSQKAIWKIAPTDSPR